jgi:hypothetical protein
MSYDHLAPAGLALVLAAGVAFTLVGTAVAVIESRTNLRLGPEGKWFRRMLFAGPVLVAVGLVVALDLQWLHEPSVILLTLVVAIGLVAIGRHSRSGTD